MIEVKSKLNNLRMSPRKVRLVADLIRGLYANQAKTVLQFSVKSVANPILKCLNSAISNAEHNFGINKNNLFISKITVDGGRSLKRQMPRAMGRASLILKRTSDILIILKEKERQIISDKDKVLPAGRQAEEKVAGEKKIGKEAFEKKEKKTDYEKRQPARLPSAKPASKKRIFQRKSI